MESLLVNLTMAGGGLLTLYLIRQTVKGRFVGKLLILLILYACIYLIMAHAVLTGV